ncbi:hypothetical protein FB99_17240 [Pantoea agglomerans]|nr:hypothetical protein FB99_17240 [Pantoea agglomerans]
MLHHLFHYRPSVSVLIISQWNTPGTFQHGHSYYFKSY